MHPAYFYIFASIWSWNIVCISEGVIVMQYLFLYYIVSDKRDNKATFQIYFTRTHAACLSTYFYLQTNTQMYAAKWIIITFLLHEFNEQFYLLYCICLIRHLWYLVCLLPWVFSHCKELNELYLCLPLHFGRLIYFGRKR